MLLTILKSRFDLEFIERYDATVSITLFYGASMPGIFLDYLLKFNKLNINQQAEEILKVVDHYFRRGYLRVGITYSANRCQAQIARSCNNSFTGIAGANQAEVIQAIESLLRTNLYQHLQGFFYVLPITTCEFAGGFGAVKDEWLQEDFDYINKFIQEDGVVLGWQNHSTIENVDAPYAIGGGVSRQLSAEQNTRAQNFLKQLKQRYPAASDTLEVSGNDVEHKGDNHIVISAFSEKTFLTEFNERNDKSFRSYWKKRHATSIEEIAEHALGAHSFCLFGYSGKGTCQYLQKQYGISMKKKMTTDELVSEIRQRLS